MEKDSPLNIQQIMLFHIGGYKEGKWNYLKVGVFADSSSQALVTLNGRGIAQCGGTSNFRQEIPIQSNFRQMLSQANFRQKEVDPAILRHPQKRRILTQESIDCRSSSNNISHGLIRDRNNAAILQKRIKIRIVYMQVFTCVPTYKYTFKYKPSLSSEDNSNSVS